ncbi:hypothetical protein TSOC_010094 [Tetrabaena socialis]|uniref:Ycf66-like protein n=1 Tax=Tetrabaena socialis TaxID=47790 RepID=A0A2J7ZU62_9CHLO|nr:hypothetical protein TSOC_010094 [Tetrabaena socialis]|eukprot:PNH03813.1 hypothetical protein TSOC_010094 [Tetrabaena socialis]
MRLDPQTLSRLEHAGCPQVRTARPACARTRGRQLVVRARAMVNVDFASPSLLLGTGLIGCGVLLLNLRNFQNKVSRDADIVVAAMVSIVGSTLIFQGWRLDPLLLLCQALTTSVAFWYGLETFRLRSKEADLLPPGVGPDFGSMDAAQLAAMMQQQQQQQYYQQQGGAGYPPAGAPFLPPGAEASYPWGDAQGSTASSSGSQGPYAETIQYDYYGNPMMPQEQLYDNAGPAGPYGDPYGQPAGAAAAYGGGGAYGAPTGGAGPGPSSASADGGGGGGGRWSGAAAGPTGPVEYGYRGGPVEGGAGYSSAPPGGPGGAWVNAAPEQYSLPPVTSASGGSGPAGGPEPQYGSVYAPGGGDAVGGDVPYSGGGGAQWDGRRQAAGGAGGRTQAGGRMDLYEKVDDWE